MATHTPGPWEIDPRWKHNGNNPSPLVIYTSFGSVATIHGGTKPDDETLPNARLIAAAPMLLDALRLLLDRYVTLVNCGDCGNWNPEEEQSVILCRAAIAKAEGPDSPAKSDRCVHDRAVCGICQHEARS